MISSARKEPHPGFLNPQRTKTEGYLDDFFFTQDYNDLMGASRERRPRTVINLMRARRWPDRQLPGMPHLGVRHHLGLAGKPSWQRPNLNEGLVSIIDTGNWQLIKKHPHPGAGAFSCAAIEKSRYAWTDSMMHRGHRRHLAGHRQGDTGDRGAPARRNRGKTLAHVDSRAMGATYSASLWERKAAGGALIVFMRRHSRRSSVFRWTNLWVSTIWHNKITRSEGTSHLSRWKQCANEKRGKRSCSVKSVLVGARSGDRELLTLRAYRPDREAEAVVYRQLVGDEGDALISPAARTVYAGKKSRAACPAAGSHQ